MIICNGKRYSSQKFPLLEYIFDKYNPTHDRSITNITFTLADIHEAYISTDIKKITGKKTTKIAEPASISNTILDLVRKDRGINSRLPVSIINLGYDLRKKTGPEEGINNYAGEFVFVGVGNALKSWLDWPSGIIDIPISSKPIPDFVRPYLRNDEGGLFSVLDYCDVLSMVLYNKPGIVFRVQHPLKWQPNEIDGF